MSTRLLIRWSQVRFLHGPLVLKVQMLHRYRPLCKIRWGCVKLFKLLFVIRGSGVQIPLRAHFFSSFIGTCRFGATLVNVGSKLCKIGRLPGLRCIRSSIYGILTSATRSPSLAGILPSRSLKHFIIHHLYLVRFGATFAAVLLPFTGLTRCMYTVALPRILRLRKHMRVFVCIFVLLFW